MPRPKGSRMISADCGGDDAGNESLCRERPGMQSARTAWKLMKSTETFAVSGPGCNLRTVKESMRSTGEKMILFHADLDNTLIYSYRRLTCGERIGVEEYRGKTVSYMTPESCRLLRGLGETVLTVPTTTRTEEQYGRIDLGIGTPRYALVCNGGVLLEDGKENAAWYEESLAMTDHCRKELLRAEELLSADLDRSFEVRNIRDLFVFTKSERPERTAERLRAALDLSKADVMQNGVKVYVLPKILNKGTAVRRLRDKLTRLGERADYVVAAGDSAFDLPMAEAADLFLAPEDLIVGAGRGVEFRAEEGSGQESYEEEGFGPESCGEEGLGPESRGRGDSGSESYEEKGSGPEACEEEGLVSKFFGPESHYKEIFAAKGCRAKILQADGGIPFSDFVLRCVSRIAAERSGETGGDVCNELAAKRGNYAQG